MPSRLRGLTRFRRRPRTRYVSGRSNNKNRAITKLAITRQIGRGVHYFDRTTTTKIGLVDDAVQIISGCNDYTNGFFALSLLPSYGEFTALFDSFKILGITQTFIYSANSAQATETGTIQTANCLPLIISVIDKDDGTPMVTTAGSYAEVDQYQGVLIKRMDKQFTRKFVPLPQTMVYKTAVTTGYSTPGKPIWMDCNDATIPHYGHKYAFDKQLAGSTNDGLGYITLRTTYHLAFRTVR